VVLDLRKSDEEGILKRVTEKQRVKSDSDTNHATRESKED
jgi:hypothetical protein